MKKLFIMRHATADNTAQFNDDHDKPLTQKGCKEARDIGKFMAEQHLLPTHILCSDARRTRQTLENMLPFLNKETHIHYLHTLYLATPGEMLKIITETPDSCHSLMVLAHNPGVHQLANFLAKEDESHELIELRRSFAPATLACFTVEQPDWKNFDPQCTQLQKYLVATKFSTSKA